MAKYEASNRYVQRVGIESDDTVYIASDRNDAVKIAELMNELDKATNGKWQHPTECELRRCDNPFHNHRNYR